MGVGLADRRAVDGIGIGGSNNSRGFKVVFLSPASGGLGTPILQYWLLILLTTAMDKDMHQV